MTLQEIVGSIFVWTGLVLFGLQIVLAVLSVLKPPASIATDAGFFEKIFKALVDKFPVAAFGIAAVWLGSNILGLWTTVP